ncbi:UNVERIFIED_CONTAM: hypothetical protein FKN15_000899 [Acipenser sinensis]
MDRNALTELLEALESRRDAEERRREERYTALIERGEPYPASTKYGKPERSYAKKRSENPRQPKRTIKPAKAPELRE